MAEWISLEMLDDVEDGPLAWVTVALGLGSDRGANLTAAAHYYTAGGVAVEGSSEGLPPSEPNAS